MHLNNELLRDIIQWDIKTWSKALPFWEDNFEIKKGMSALTVGEREGGLTLWLALKDVHVVCTDFKTFPDETKLLHQKYEVSRNITYENGVDTTDLSQFPANSFDVVLFKSVLGALSEKDRQQTAFNEMKRVLKPGGAVLFAENSKGSKLHGALRKKFVLWNHYWRYLDFKKDKDLFTEFSSSNLKSMGFSATFGRSEKQRSILASVDYVFQPLIPSSYKYVLFGVLIK